MPKLFLVGTLGVLESIPVALMVGPESDKDVVLLQAVIIVFCAVIGALRFGTGYAVVGETSFLLASRVEVVDF